MDYLKYFALLLIFASCSIEQENNPVSTSFYIEGEVCEIGCKKLIEHNLIRLSGVDKAVFNYNEKVIKVDYHSGLISSYSIKKSIESLRERTGYMVTKIQNNKVVSRVRLAESRASQNIEGDELPTRISFPSIFRLFLGR